MGPGVDRGHRAAVAVHLVGQTTPYLKKDNPGGEEESVEDVPPGEGLDWLLSSPFIVFSMMIRERRHLIATGI